MTQEAGAVDAATGGLGSCYICREPVRGEAYYVFGRRAFCHMHCHEEEADMARKGKQMKARKQTRAVAPKAVKATEPRVSLMSEAIDVMREVGAAMTTKEIVEKVLARGRWTTAGKTPAQTLYASILREIQKKGEAARFAKAEGGKFALKA